MSASLATPTGSYNHWLERTQTARRLIVGFQCFGQVRCVPSNGQGIDAYGSNCNVDLRTYLDGAQPSYGTTYPANFISGTGMLVTSLEESAISVKLTGTGDEYNVPAVLSVGAPAAWSYRTYSAAAGSAAVLIEHFAAAP